MSVFTLGLNHTTAPVDLRGRFAFSPEQLSPALRGFRERLMRALPEAALLSTCNRTELYVAAEPAQVHALVAPAIEWFAAQGGVPGDQLRIEVETIRAKPQVGHVRARCKVGGRLVAEAELKFTLVDA